MTSDPLSLLRAGLDEDERIARAAAGARWVADVPPSIHVSPEAIAENKHAFGRLGYVGTVERDADREHAVRQCPKATLDGVEAIRKVIAEREAEHTRVQVSDPVVRAYGDGYRAAYDRIAGILASIYAPEPTETGEPQ